jgi:hypothetical protein
VRIFACGTSLRLSYRLTQYGHTFCCSVCTCSMSTVHINPNEEAVFRHECWPLGCAGWVRYHCGIDGTKFRSALFIVAHILLTYIAVQMTALISSKCLRRDYVAILRLVAQTVPKQLQTFPRNEPEECIFMLCPQAI